jgi:hypothetical protein
MRPEKSVDIAVICYEEPLYSEFMDNSTVKTVNTIYSLWVEPD